MLLRSGNKVFHIRFNGVYQPIVVQATLRNVLDQGYGSTTGYQLGLTKPRTFLLSTTFQF
ncbi:hypothetical protein NWI01_32990 [Nitrobacter winogradskyi]|uniref:TonB-dependent receptor-like beta-barrel domain-containing protein n=1 Tax=Nitrobacter winogradskyi TaxID=913 RepID=A0A4Y3WEG2_NITWI|nr:hypothetical protein NWI01_32990 [Nitrobacter winogradskyi]